MKRLCAIGLLGVLAIAAGAAGAEIHDITWTLGPDLPHYRKGAAIGVVGGEIVSACGMEHPWCEAASTFALPSLSAGAWQQLPDCPLGRAYVHGAALNDSLYVVGGRNSGAAIGNVDKLTKSGDTWSWSSLPGLNQARTHAPVAAIGGKLYVVGGNNWSGSNIDSLGSVEVFDTEAASPSWTVATQIPDLTRAASSVAAVNGKLYVFGGINWHKTSSVDTRIQLDEVKVYDPAADTWEALPPLPFKYHGSECVVYDDRYVVITGGACYEYPEEYQQRKEEIPGHGGYWNPFVVVYDTLEPGARVLPTPLLYPTNDISVVLFGDTLVAVGGENIDPTTSNTTKWVRYGTIDTMPEPSTLVLLVVAAFVVGTYYWRKRS